MNECSNCGDYYFVGEGFPEDERECCCSPECWIEFTNNEFN